LIEARCTQRDALVFAEKSVELMIDGGDCYYEIAINALGTIYEVFFIWKDAFRRGGRFDQPEFDVLERDVLTFCGDSDRDPETFWRGTHPRGCRWAFLDWDLQGLRVNVSIDGSMNDPTHADVGWRVDLMIPWAAMQWLAGDRPLPPIDGDEWHIYFARNLTHDVGGRDVHPGPIWALRPHGVRDAHRTECFPRVVFSKK